MTGRLNQRAADYLESRKLDVVLAGQYQLRSASRADGKFEVDDRSGMLAIPYFVGERIVFTKYKKLYDLKEDEPSWAMHGKPVAFWNQNVLTDPGLRDEPLIITEGEWDALALLQCGFQRVVSVPNGATEEGTPEQLGYVTHAEAALRGVRKIILAVDNDYAGQVLRENLLIRLGRARCHDVEYPLKAKGGDQRCKDFNEVFDRYGKRGVETVIKAAKPVPMDGLFSFDDLPDEPEQAPPLKVEAFGPDLHRFIGIRNGDLSFWTGQPGGGKTTLLRGISWALADQFGTCTSAAFFEDKPKRDTVRNLKRLWGNGWPENDLQADAEDWIRAHYQFVLKLGRGRPTINWFLDQADAAVSRHGCKLVIADPWSQFAINPRRGEDKLDAILENIVKLKIFAEDMNCHVAVIAHPRKPSTYGGTDQLADGYDISGSKDFFDRCDLGVTVQADPRAKFLTNVRVWKSRDREEQGDIGDFSLRLSPHSKRFAPIHPEDAEALRNALSPNIVPFKKMRTADRRVFRRDVDE